MDEQYVTNFDGVSQAVEPHSEVPKDMGDFCDQSTEGTGQGFNRRFEQRSNGSSEENDCSVDQPPRLLRKQHFLALSGYDIGIPTSAPVEARRKRPMLVVSIASIAVGSIGVAIGGMASAFTLAIVPLAVAVLGVLGVIKYQSPMERFRWGLMEMGLEGLLGYAQEVDDLILKYGPDPFLELAYCGPCKWSVFKTLPKLRSFVEKYGIQTVVNVAKASRAKYGIETVLLALSEKGFLIDRYGSYAMAQMLGAVGDNGYWLIKGSVMERFAEHYGIEACVALAKSVGENVNYIYNAAMTEPFKTIFDNHGIRHLIMIASKAGEDMGRVFTGLKNYGQLIDSPESFETFSLSLIMRRRATPAKI